MSSADFTPVTVPARIADLEFTFLRPANFHPLELPEEKPNFENAAQFFPLHIVMASYGMVLFSAGARPAYSDGTVQDWAEYVTRENKLRVHDVQRGVIGGLPAVMVEASQDSESGPMHVRTAFLEDGKRFLSLSIMAPAAIWPGLESTLHLALSSFRLAEPRGTSTPLMREDVKAMPMTPDAEMAAVDASDVPPAAADVSVGARPTASSLALAADAATFDPEHPVNVRLREQGTGLTPRLLGTNASDKCATFGAGAIEAMVQVPFGWHLLDDGRRTLVFDAGGRIQINLDLRHDGGNAHGLLQAIAAEAKSEQPQIDPLAMDFAADLPGVVLRNYRDGDDVLVQAFVVRELRGDGLAHVARVTAAPDDMAQAMNLAEFILRSLALPASVQ